MALQVVIRMIYLWCLIIGVYAWEMKEPFAYVKFWLFLFVLFLVEICVERKKGLLRG